MFPADRDNSRGAADLAAKDRRRRSTSGPANGNECRELWRGSHCGTDASVDKPRLSPAWTYYHVRHVGRDIWPARSGAPSGWRSSMRRNGAGCSSVRQPSVPDNERSIARRSEAIGQLKFVRIASDVAGTMRCAGTWFPPRGGKLLRRSLNEGRLAGIESRRPAWQPCRGGPPPLQQDPASGPGSR